jgi:hypothetical protein
MRARPRDVSRDFDGIVKSVQRAQLYANSLHAPGVAVPLLR